MDRRESSPNDPATRRPSSEPRPDGGDATPPHGDDIVNEERNMSRHGTPPWVDSDSDRPSR